MINFVTLLFVSAFLALIFISGIGLSDSTNKSYVDSLSTIGEILWILLLGIILILIIASFFVSDGIKQYFSLAALFMTIIGIVTFMVLQGMFIDDRNDKRMEQKTEIQNKKDIFLNTFSRDYTRLINDYNKNGEELFFSVDKELSMLLYVVILNYGSIATGPIGKIEGSKLYVVNRERSYFNDNNEYITEFEYNSLNEYLESMDEWINNLYDTDGNTILDNYELILTDKTRYDYEYPQFTP